MEPIVELESVSYRLEGARIIDDVTWQLHKGQHWAVLGPNGAGKTTLLKLLCGELWPNDGGRVLRRGSERFDLRQLRRSIGWLTTTTAARVPEQQSVLDTVVAGGFAQIRLIPMPWDPPLALHRDRARTELHRLGVLELEQRAFGTLSHGEQQRTLIARALMASPELLILDEPTSGLDPGARENLLWAIQTLTSEAAPLLVITTHHTEEIMPGFDHTLAIRRGRSVSMGPTKEVLTSDLLTTLYDHRFRLEHHGGRVWALGEAEGASGLKEP